MPARKINVAKKAIVKPIKYTDRELFDWAQFHPEEVMAEFHATRSCIGWPALSFSFRAAISDLMNRKQVKKESIKKV